jgi:hypothetical protein
MSEQKINSTNQDINVRPSSLSHICILTFIGSGLSAIVFLLIFLIYDLIPDLLLQDEFAANGMILNEITTKANRIFFFIMPILYALSITGAVMMWKLKKKGFHLYTIVQLLMLLLPFFMVTDYSISFPNALITAIFIGAYSLNFSQMR